VRKKKSAVRDYRSPGKDQKLFRLKAWWRNGPRKRSVQSGHRRPVCTESFRFHIWRANAWGRREIQLTDALQSLCRDEKVYACLFEGKRYDAGDKLGYLIATVEYALESPQLGRDFARYLESLREELPRYSK
jgi:hypothetical protein